ncbi:phosphoribosylformylglycinamidine synthase [Salsuginibacillus halophilus]|uniref:Phosphoribosylformylglycinamidine synthase subunit PurS n=1 Tax=Salsuginibacillus halophilus TaxID=517424 RepID=A0A2P8HLE6_9BACI|nr:phosphoribosylformylglycinamidine synthase subunit PurS [Salsuginibacillus halophilus]PSL47037.1 phosphoribosylformylglycinamidine synthase [Salsuginibacillus halophilus]
MKTVHVYVTLKEGVLNPEGSAIERSLHALGYEEVQKVQTGKWVSLQVEDGPELAQRVERMCEQLLANPVIEDYEIQLSDEVTT